MGEESSKTHDVFLSYSSKDKTWADSACAVLEQHRIRCWIAPRDMTPGDEWAAGIIKGLNASRVMVLIFSDHANASKQVRKEVVCAIEKELPVLAFRIQDVKPKDAMEFNLTNIHWLDAFTPPRKAQLESLAGSVKKLLGQETGPPDPPPKRPFGKKWLIAIAASIFGLVALCVLVMAIQARNGGPKTIGAGDSSSQAEGTRKVVEHDSPKNGPAGHTTPTADSPGAKTPIPSPPRDRIPPKGPARLTRRSVPKGMFTVEGDQLIKEDLEVGGFAFGDAGWSDYDFTVEARKSEGPGGFRFDFRLDEGKGYNLALGGWDNKKHYLSRTSNPSGVKGQGVGHEIQSSPGAIRSFEWYKLKISLRGPRIRIALDDHLIFDCTDNLSEKGMVALRCLNSAGRFRNIKVTAPDGTVLWEGPPDLREE